MKINPIMMIVSLAVAALTGYGFWAGTHLLLNTIGSAFCILLILGTLLSFSFKEDGRLTANLKVVAGIFTVLAIIEQIIFAFMPESFRTAYIVVTGILLLSFIIIEYAIYSASK